MKKSARVSEKLVSPGLPGLQVATHLVYTDNNSLTYVLSTAKLNGTILRWVGQLANLNFESRYRPGRLNTDADSLSRFPSDLKKKI